MAADMMSMPVMPAPLGVEHDFSGRKTPLQKKIVIVYLTMTILSTMVLCLRLYTRIFIRHTTGPDDIFIVLSWLGCIAWVAICFSSFQYGFGQHLWNVTVAQMMDYTRILIGIITIYVWTPALTKLSLLALYHRLNPDRIVRWCVYALAVLVFGYSLAITVVAAGPCNAQTHRDPKCLTDLNLFMAVINIVTDFFILCLPIPMLIALQLPWKQKIALGSVFAVGSGVIVISIVRIIYIYHWILNPDATYNQAAACIFSTVEMNGGVICACIALLKPFFQQHMPWLLSFSSHSGSASGSRLLRMFGRRKDIESYELRISDGDPTEGVQGPDKKGLGGQIAVTRTYSVRGFKGSKESEAEKTNSDSMEDLFRPM